MSHHTAFATTREFGVATVELFGAAAVASMALFYALEHRSPTYIFLFAVACFATAFYGIAIESWPVAAVESVWGVLALRRWLRAPDRRMRPSPRREH